jgi:hypothetical protein
MDERTLKALVAAGAIRSVSIIASGAQFHVRATTPNGAVTAETRKGKVRTWVSLDAAARWVRGLGVGAAEVLLHHWHPGQREICIRSEPVAKTGSGKRNGASHDQGELFGQDRAV